MYGIETCLPSYQAGAAFWPSRKGNPLTLHGPLHGPLHDFLRG
jgi:hypothetical protein